MLEKYIDSGVQELATDKLADLLKLKYYAISDAKAKLGEIAEIRRTFNDFQQYLYL